MLMLDMQRRLAALGYDVGQDKLGEKAFDGLLGDLTRAGIKLFQADHHLVEDGKPGPVTQEALRKAKPAVRSVVAAKPVAAPAKRKVNLIVVHCTATREGQDFTVKQIDAMHRAQGWSQIGYHWLIRLDGTVERGRPEEIVGAHVSGHNTGSIGISYVGGLDASGKAKDTRTAAQKAAIERMLADLVARYPVTRICGHRDLSPDKNGNGTVEPREWVKVCPCYSAEPEHAHLLRRRAA